MLCFEGTVRKIWRQNRGIPLAAGSHFRQSGFGNRRTGLFIVTGKRNTISFRARNVLSFPEQLLLSFSKAIAKS